jgi:hypothetical protein
MSSQLYLVFSNPPAGVSEEEYDRWYYQHVRENVEVPGFVAGQRFAATLVMSGSRTAPGRFTSDSETVEVAPSLDFRHVAMYEFDGDIADLRRALFERIESGDTVLPDWFDEIRFMTWTFAPVDERVQPTRLRTTSLAETAG